MSDEPDLEKIGERIDELARVTDELRALGEARGVPAIERNAKRIEGIVAMLERNVPPELRKGGRE